MADPVTLTYITIGAAVASTAVQYKQTKAQQRIMEWEHKETSRKADLEYKTQEANRLSRVRQALASNTVQAAVSGVSINSGTPAEAQRITLDNLEKDQINSRATYLGTRNALDYKLASGTSINKLQGYGSLLSGISQAAQTGTGATRAGQADQLLGQG